MALEEALFNAMTAYDNINGRINRPEDIPNNMDLLIDYFRASYEMGRLGMGDQEVGHIVVKWVHDTIDQLYGLKRANPENSNIWDYYLVKLKSLTKKPIKGQVQKVVNLIKAKKDPPFKWQKICSAFGNQELSTLQKLATLHGIPEAMRLNKRELCKQLAIQTEKLQTPRDCANETSILGDSIDDIPKYLVYSFIENGRRYCFNILELMEYLKTNNTNPFTRVPLDVKAINDRFNVLKQMLSENALAIVDILDEIKQKPVMDKQSILRLAITNLISGMHYPPDVEQIMEMSEIQIRRLISIINKNPIFNKYRGVVSLNNLIDFLTNSIIGENRELKLVAIEEYMKSVLSDSRRSSMAISDYSTGRSSVSSSSSSSSIVQPRFAVVTWVKTTNIGHKRAEFIMEFSSLENAIVYARDFVSILAGDSPIINERLDPESPYQDYFERGYGYRENGDTVYYSVVRWFPGVENSWSFGDRITTDQWIPEY
jgi:hypothetical protein